jgi:hypothetical protein
MFNKLGPSRGFNFLISYLERQMDLGRLRRQDPGAAARCFIGPMVAFVLTREVFPQADSETLEPKVMVNTLVDVYLRGMAPDPDQQNEITRMARGRRQGDTTGSR